MEKIKHKIFGIVIFVFTFFVVFFFGTIVSSEFKISELFKKGRASVLDKRPKEFTHDIVVDLTMILENGGILILTENILEGIIKKRPNWRIILIAGQGTNKTLYRFSCFRNVKIINVRALYNDIRYAIFRVINYLTCNLIRNKLIQFIFYDKLFIDDKCDLFWDPSCGWRVNDFDIPKATTIHDLYHMDIGDNLPQNVIDWVSKRIACAVKRSRKIITVSNFSKKRILDRFNVKNDFVKTIHIKMANRLKDTAVSQNVEEQILEKYKIKKKKYLIYIASMWPNKNHGRLLEAFAKFIKKNSSDIKLVIAGFGGQSTLRALVKRLDLKQEVILTDQIPKTDLNTLLSNTLASIHPSLYEGFGMTIIESMAAGVPVACSECSSLPEIAANAALYFNPYSIDQIENAISTIVSDKNFRETLINLGHQRAKVFMDNNSMIDEYISTFEEIMNI